MKKELSLTKDYYDNYFKTEGMRSFEELSIHEIKVIDNTLSFNSYLMEKSYRSIIDSTFEKIISIIKYFEKLFKRNKVTLFKPNADKNQVEIVKEHLMDKGKISTIEGMFLYGIKNVPAQVSKLRAKGYLIELEDNYYILK